MPLPVPPDLEAALAADPTARATFDRLPPEGRDRWIAWVQRARTPRGRAKRIAYVVQRLGAPVAPATTTVQEETAPPLPPREEWWPWLLGLALALLLAALLVWLLVYRDSGGTHSNVVVQKGTVPNVVGRRQADAERAVRQASLTPVVRKQTSTAPVGAVVSENPAPGTVLKSGASVTLIVSRGPPPAAVPDVTGLAAADAVARLQRAKLLPRLVEVRSKRTAGTVVAQKPSAGANAKPGSTVTLQVSKGVGKVTVPAVVGETVAQAVAELRTVGLKAQTTGVVSDQRRGTVLEQSPRGGEAAAKGATVRLTVSKGPPGGTTAVTTTQLQTTTVTTTAPAPATTQAAGQVGVPSLVGQGFASALGALERAGLRAFVKYQSSQAPLGQVRGQNPAAGTSVPPKTRVQVNASEGPTPGNPTQVPDETGQDEATARSDLEAAGFKVVVIQRSGTSAQPGTVVELQPSAGTTIASGDYVAIYVAR